MIVGPDIGNPSCSTVDRVEIAVHGNATLVVGCDRDRRPVVRAVEDRRPTIRAAVRAGVDARVCDEVVPHRCIGSAAVHRVPGITARHDPKKRIAPTPSRSFIVVPPRRRRILELPEYEDRDSVRKVGAGFLSVDSTARVTETFGWPSGSRCLTESAEIFGADPSSGAR